MPKKRIREKRLYSIVESYVKRRFRCFATGQNRGTRHGRIDVVGVRDVGRDLSGEFEVIGVEVKAGYQPFGSAAGQAAGYSVYANRCYLADLRTGSRPFTDEEIDIASSLGIGLLAVSLKSVRAILAAPRKQPINGLQLELIEKLKYSQCTLCRSLFLRTKTSTWGTEVSRASIFKAYAREKGLIYWLKSVSKRRKQDTRSLVYQRRYFCPDCVDALHD